MKIDPQTGKPIVELSHSGLSTFASCPKKFAFRKIIVNFSNDREESDATAVGTAMHEAIQEYMRSRSFSAALEALGTFHPVVLQDKAKASSYSLEACVWTLEHLVHETDVGSYDLVSFTKDGKTIPATEVPFLVIIETKHLVFHVRGFIDLVLRNPVTGHLMPVDIKTMLDRALSTLESKYMYDWQVTSYGIPLNALLGNAGDFDVAIMAVALSDREPQVKMPIFTRTQADIDAYHYYLIDKCHQIERYYLADQFPRHPNACVSFGQTCFYQNACQQNSVQGMQMIVNPSKAEGYKTERPFEPVYTVVLEGH